MERDKRMRLLIFIGGDRAEQRLCMCKGCGGLGSKMVSICMGLVREVEHFVDF